MQPIMTDLAVLRKNGKTGWPSTVTVNLYRDRIEIISSKTDEALYNIPLSTLTKTKPFLGGGVLLSTSEIKISLDFNSVAGTLIRGPLWTMFRNNKKAKLWVSSILQAKEGLSTKPA